jgi:esterase/lipase superfamily enzyme
MTTRPFPSPPAARFSAMARLWLSLAVLAVALAGCARPGPGVLIPTDAVAPGARLVTVYVATTRARDPDAMNVYTSDRAPVMNYAEFTIAIPPNHKAGEIEWPTGLPDPAKNFVTVRQNLLTSAEFESKVAARAGGDNRKAGVFVHGYNVNFQEAVFRLAQMTADADILGVPILFAWPSDGKLVGYVADKDAATYSRDALAQLLTMLARDRKPADITLLGHSMGAWLTVESVRQLRLTGRTATLNRLNVILASPDIDIDVFRVQMRAIGPLTPPLTVLVSRDDRALALSGRISGERTRLGALNVDDPRVQEGARAANVRIIDISKVEATDGFNHDRFVTLATLYSRLDRMERNGAGAGPGQAGAFVFNTVGNVLSAPFTLVGGVLSGQ